MGKEITSYHVNVFVAHSFMYRPVHPSLGRVKTNMDWQKYGWMGKKMKEPKSLSKS